MQTEEGQNLAAKIGALFMETSSKTNDGVFSMLFNSISYFPFFTKLKVNRSQLVKELEQENGGGLTDDPSGKNISLLNSKKDLNKANCKC